MNLLSAAIAATASAMETASVIAAAEPIMGRPSWSEKRWAFIANRGPAIVHSHPGGRGKPRKSVSVASHLLVRIDRTRYPADALRAIRSREVNFRGERQR